MYKKFILPIFILVLSANTLWANAAIECTQIEATKREYAENQGGPNLETTSVFDSVFGSIGTMAHIASNDTASMIVKCGAQRLKDISATSDTNLDFGSSCVVEDPERCADMGLLNPVQGQGQTTYKPKGSLMGMATVLEQTTKDPIPLNLAYYVNQNAQKIPLLKNTAFAQEVEYGGPFLGAIYHYWTISRNIAYAFLAMAMMVVGILIITRQKIDAKASVTVQQALPQIVIALILITFSYPIGAAGASLAYNIRGSLDSSELLNVANDMDVTSVSIVNFGTIIYTLGAGIVAAISSIIALIISLLMGIQVFLKILGIYLKMLFATITAPLVFAIGAVPGNQNSTVNWFKQFGSYIVSLPAMSFGAWFVFGLIKDVGLKSVTSFEEFGGMGFGILAAAATAAITYYGYSLVLTIPDKIDEMFGVKSGKK